MSKYCSLKEAFKQPVFFRNEEEIIIPKSDPHIIPYTIQQTQEDTRVLQEPIKERFEENEEYGCEYVKSHISTCKHCSSGSNSPVDIMFSDILNILLIILLAWIIIYKPNI